MRGTEPLDLNRPRERKSHRAIGADAIGAREIGLPKDTHVEGITDAEAGVGDGHSGGSLHRGGKRWTATNDSQAKQGSSHLHGRGQYSTDSRNQASWLV